MERILKDKWALFLALISIISFVIIMINLSNPYLLSIDYSINSFMALVQNPYLLNVAEILGYIFDSISILIMILIISAVIFIYGLRKDSLFLLSTGIATGVFVFLLKGLISRERPLNSIIQELTSSFPSGHAAVSFILFGFFIYLTLKYKPKMKKLLVAALVIFILLIGFSRVYLNAHWFSDVIGGFLLGVFLFFSAMSVWENQQ